MFGANAVGSVVSVLSLPGALQGRSLGLVAVQSGLQWQPIGREHSRSVFTAWSVHTQSLGLVKAASALPGASVEGGDAAAPRCHARGRHYRLLPVAYFEKSIRMN